MNIWPVCLECNVRKGNSLPDARATVAYSRWLARQPARPIRFHDEAAWQPWAPKTSCP
jgi:5-methylcytosine-specific restriction endonuclease McrA